ncbi:MAG: DUF559 domain-containing protein [Acidimicrobiia bacterium]|nr:DUF559 domain-containing protein [Acidimicrobiia bacterium]
MDRCIERAIAELALTQLSHITQKQLRQLGVSAKVARRLVDTGRLVPVGRATFRMGGVPPSFEGLVMAACLDTGGVVSHRTACRLHGLGPKRWIRGPIEVTRLKRERHGPSPLARVHTTTELGPDDLVVVRGIASTSVARTLLGLAGLVPEVRPDEVRGVVDAAVRAGLASDKWLWWRLEQLRCKGRNGVSLLEAILSDRAKRGRTESWLEVEFLDLLDAVGFPRPEVQRRVAHRGAFVARVDFFYAPKLVIEVSGREGHVTDEERAADAIRLNALQAEGYTVIEFTYEQIVRQPELVLAAVAQHLSLAARR